MRAVELRTNGAACEPSRVSKFPPSPPPDETRAGLWQAKRANGQDARFVPKVDIPKTETRTAKRGIRTPSDIFVQVRREAVQGQRHALGHRYVIVQLAAGALAILLVIGWEAQLRNIEEFTRRS